MQAQVPTAPYVGLWTRLESFGVEELSSLVVERRVVRASMMRATIHLVSDRDFLALRSAVQPVLERDVYGNATYGKDHLEGLDVGAVLAAGRTLLEERPGLPPSFAACSDRGGRTGIPRRSPTPSAACCRWCTCRRGASGTKAAPWP
jgi:hypothetical protein